MESLIYFEHLSLLQLTTSFIYLSIFVGGRGLVVAAESLDHIYNYIIQSTSRNLLALLYDDDYLFIYVFFFSQFNLNFKIPLQSIYTSIQKIKISHT